MDRADLTLGGGGDEGIPEELPQEDEEREDTPENPATASALGSVQSSHTTKLSKQTIAKQVT